MCQNPWSALVGMSICATYLVMPEKSLGGIAHRWMVCVRRECCCGMCTMRRHPGPHPVTIQRSSPGSVPQHTIADRAAPNVLHRSAAATPPGAVQSVPTFLRLVLVWAFAVLMTSRFAYTVYGLIIDETGAQVGIAFAAFVSGAIALWCLRSAVVLTRRSHRAQHVTH